jgi:hypothetical protein
MLTDVLRAAFYIPMPEGHKGAPVLLWGRSGIGKTAVARAAANACGLYHYRLAPSERGEGQFGVVPVPGSDGYLHYPPPVWAQDVDARPSLLFLDEVDSVPLALQPPLLGMVQLRILGSHQFAKSTRVMAAANGVTGTWELRPDILNRFCHLEFEGYSAEEWTGALLGGFAAEATTGANTAADIEARVDAAWPGAVAKARGMVSGFITRRPELLDKRPAKGSTDRAFPTPRTCEYASLAIAAADVHGLSESDADTLIAGFVGLGWVSEYRKWSLDADLPDPAAFLDGKAKFVHDHRRLDRTLAHLGACAATIIPEKSVRRQDRGEVLVKFLDTLMEDAADLVVPVARQIIKAGAIKMGANSAWVKLGGGKNRILDMLTAAGLR